MSIYFFIALISGFSALAFETLWFRLMGLVLGSGIWASALVLSSFMAGLALGNLLAGRLAPRIRQPLRAYSWIELTIGLTGLGLVFLIPELTGLLARLFQHLLDSGFKLNVLRLAVAFLLLIVPTAAMGATLPVLMEHLAKRSESFGRKLGMIYGANTLGAVVGVVGCEILLVPVAGIAGAGIVSACLNGMAALLAYALSRDHSAASLAKRRAADRAISRHRPVWSVGIAHLLTASFLCGAIFLGFEVVLFRFLLLFFTSLSMNFTVMLAVVLVGIALGGLTASKLFRREIDPRTILPAVAFTAGLSLVASYGLFRFVLGPASRLSTLGAVFVTTAFLALPLSLLSGLLFTMLGHALHKEGYAQGAATGLVTASNTIGAATGSLLTGFYLISKLGIEKCLLVFMIGYGVVGLVVMASWIGKGLLRGPWATLTAGILFACSLAFLPWGQMETVFLEMPVLPLSRMGENRVALKEGQLETLQYLRCDSLGRPDYYRLVVNNHTMSATDVRSRRYMRLFAYFPSIFHPEPRRAALLGLGLGVTATALTEDPRLTSIEVVDISRDIVAMSSVLHPDPVDNPLSDPRVHVHIEDGRFFLMTSPERYDIITAEPPPPHYMGVSNLYSREFFQLIAQRLAPGGIVTYWLPVHDLKVREAQAIVGAFLQAFPEGSLWTGSGLDWMMVGLKPPLAGPDEESFRRWWTDSRQSEGLREIGLEDPESLGALFVADGMRLRAWLDEAPVLTDNWPRRTSLQSPSETLEVAAYMSLMNSPDAARNFDSSLVIRSLWPERLRVASLRRFGRQSFINAALSLPMLGLVDLQHILDSYPQDPLIIKAVFWRHNLDFERVRKLLRAEPGLKGEGLAEYHAQLALMSGSPREAAEWLARVQGPRGKRLITLRAYCLLRAGDGEGAFRLLQSSALESTGSALQPPDRTKGPGAPAPP